MQSLLDRMLPMPVIGSLTSGNAVRPERYEAVTVYFSDIIGSCRKFKIPHMPSVPFNIRVGINSVVAGIVGRVMPRYCLFGDTVNVASRLESTGRASAIHISKATETLLAVSGDYQMIYRGEILLKGRGKQPTYWLTGKKDFISSFEIPDANGCVCIIL
ncbi:retinal guanylyl cyclase 1-like protein [Dinothrombium tinctorium]|uniref:Retinal guanylyl cyclase 1-like protein n=1 Tax=Dinothrombium tinctorium TaxID=1965070 RepID=A0A443QW56_9ACAR|nr:retinal guanylyl cyclase 1-like protein [Dinothrombium tinctorium]